MTSTTILNTTKNNQGWVDSPPTAVLVLANKKIIKGKGFGSTGISAGEICFNTAMSGYQEIMTDPSYSGQIVTFTFPHIGNVGVNTEDIESTNLPTNTGVKGCILRGDITSPSNYRANGALNAWLERNNIIGICDVDTRALTAYIRKKGMINAVIAHNPAGEFDLEYLKETAANHPSLEGMDLAKDVSCTQAYEWNQGKWSWPNGFDKNTSTELHIVAIDYGLKHNILRCLATSGCRITVVPATASIDDIVSKQPDGIFLSNGPGDPAATGEYTVPVIKNLITLGYPIFGICLGHQMLALALGAKTKKMHQGHHGANHPVKDFTTSKVEITSMNHGFTVDRDSLPENVEETHISLFDNSNCGIRLKDKPVFSVQHHPEASPGPQDSHYLFNRFVDMMKEYKVG
ncbi:MAG: glutamine-hydrolyzing carbamoyl-phosphate synthase small subunit [Pseudomonadota bacterium]